MAEPDLGYYLYAVGPSEFLTDLDGLRGIDGALVECAATEQLCGLISPVSIAALRAAEHTQEVSETGWLAGAVRAHEHVSLRAMQHAAVLPMRLGTVFDHRQAVHILLQRHQRILLAELDNLGGSTEWCLTARTIRQAADRAPTAEPTTGTAWLQSRRAILQAHAARADHLHQLPVLLAPLVRDLVTSRRAGTNDTLRIWLLVADPQQLRENLHTLSDHLRELAITIELSGPWPAYHFVRTDALHPDLARDNARSPAQVAP